MIRSIYNQLEILPLVGVSSHVTGVRTWQRLYTVHTVLYKKKNTSYPKFVYDKLTVIYKFWIRNIIKNVEGKILFMTLFLCVIV